MDEKPTRASAIGANNTIPTAAPLRFSVFIASSVPRETVSQGLIGQSRVLGRFASHIASPGWNTGSGSFQWRRLCKRFGFSAIPDPSNRKHFYIPKVQTENKGDSASHHFDLGILRSYTLRPSLGAKWVYL
jgi:hypothetical protein